MREQLENLVQQLLDRGVRYDDARREFEKVFIARALQRAKGNVGDAADLLGIHRNTVARKMTDTGSSGPDRVTKNPRGPLPVPGQRGDRIERPGVRVAGRSELHTRVSDRISTLPLRVLDKARDASYTISSRSH